MIRRAAALAAAPLAALLLAAPRAAAQTPADPQPAAAPAPAFEVFPNYDFHLSAALIPSTDPRFDWDANFGGEIDLVDYGLGRARFVANYNLVLGNELRNFDPNQGNYILDLSASRRFRYAEIHGRFHHTSRHLADRAKVAPVDWNDVGVLATREEARSGVRLKESAWLERVVKRSFVDYSWILGAETSALFPLRTVQTILGPVTPVGTGRIVFTGVDADIARRGTQVGFYVEGGARLDGKKGAMELFAALERRVDATPLEREAKVWLLFGFRLVNR
jgi:hypothetical protein